MVKTSLKMFCENIIWKVSDVRSIPSLVPLVSSYGPEFGLPNPSGEFRALLPVPKAEPSSKPCRRGAARGAEIFGWSHAAAARWTCHTGAVPHATHWGSQERERERGFLMFRISWASALITISDSFGLLLPCHVWYSSPEHASMAASFQVQRSLSPLPLDTRLSMPTFGFVGACKMPCLRQIYLR